jgi:hypothetical protein
MSSDYNPISRNVKAKRRELKWLYGRYSLRRGKLVGSILTGDFHKCLRVTLFRSIA